MRVLIATDAWHPQVNGVVRTLSSLQASARRIGLEVSILSPEGFPTFRLPTYRSLQLAIPSAREIARRIEAARPDAIHIATEGPIGWTVRAFCLRRKLPFATSFTTKFPDYLSARLPVPLSFGYAVLRRFHAPARVTMVATPSLAAELRGRGFGHLASWTRGVDTDLFRPEPRAALELPRPIFLSAGRLAVEKNLAAFLSLELPGSKVILGAGPQEPELRARFPDAHFLGEKHGADLAAHMAAADVFVFPSLTDTYGVVQLEALACGVPVAAFPVTGPRDVLAGRPIGVLDGDLRAACLGALKVPRESCRAFALEQSWERSARQFALNLSRALLAPSQGALAPVPA